MSYSANDPGHNQRVKKVSYKLNIPEEVIELALFYTSEYIKKKISSIELDHDVLLQQKEFEEKLPIIKIPHLGYLKPSYWKYKAIFEKSRNKRNKENKH